MSKLLYGTTWIKEDEPCLGLYEINEMPPDGSEFHRYQIIHLMRNDNITEFRQDLGVARACPRNQIRIPGGGIDGITGVFWIEHTIGELRSMADYMRMNPSVDIKDYAAIDKWQDSKRRIIFS